MGRGRNLDWLVGLRASRSTRGTVPAHSPGSAHVPSAVTRLFEAAGPNPAERRWLEAIRVARQSDVMRIIGLDHIVLNCSDVSRSLEWYREVLGLEGERVEEWRRGEAPFPSVRVDAGTIVDLFESSDRGEGENLDHFCLVMPETDWHDMVDGGSVEVLRGPANVFGARGMGESVYTKDPDGNTVELRHYGD